MSILKYRRKLWRQKQLERGVNKLVVNLKNICWEIHCLRSVAAHDEVLKQELVAKWDAADSCLEAIIRKLKLLHPMARHEVQTELKLALSDLF